jgi:hypothetical protein
MATTIPRGINPELLSSNRPHRGEVLLTKPTMPGSRPAMSQFLQERLGGKGLTRAYYDEGEQHVVAVVEATDTPSPGLATYSTASLHAYANVMDGRDIRVELMMVCPASAIEVANVVATCAFFVMKDSGSLRPASSFRTQ